MKVQAKEKIMVSQISGCPMQKFLRGNGLMNVFQQQELPLWRPHFLHDGVMNSKKGCKQDRTTGHRSAQCHPWTFLLAALLHSNMAPGCIPSTGSQFIWQPWPDYQSQMKIQQTPKRPAEEPALISCRGQRVVQNWLPFTCQRCSQSGRQNSRAIVNLISMFSRESW